MKPFALFLAFCLTAAALRPLPAWAGPGHDHGDDAPASHGTALPRFAATSDHFELVGVLHGRQLTLYLDRAADNAPVTGARIELEIGGAKLQAAAHDDVYEVELAAAPQPGVLPVTATVSAGPDTDLLAGEWDIPAATPADAAAHGAGWLAHGWAAALAGAALAALLVLFFVGRRVAARRQARAGAAA